MKKITKATFKSFINKNRENLFLNVTSSFDGMQDCCESRHGGFMPAKKCNLEHAKENTLDVAGLWIVGGGRDYFKAFENEQFSGIEYSNSCGRGIVAIKK